jgi:hypothetical protein
VRLALFTTGQVVNVGKLSPDFTTVSSLNFFDTGYQKKPRDLLRDPFFQPLGGGNGSKKGSRTRFIDFLIVFTMKIMDIEESRIDSLIPHYLLLLTGTDAIWMEPYRAHHLSLFLTRTEKYWKRDDNLEKRVQKVRDTLQILDLPAINVK